MSTTVYIQGTDRTNDIAFESFFISRESSYKNSSLAFSMRAVASVPSEGDVVEVYEDGVLDFAGKIQLVKQTSPLPEITCEVQASDWYESTLGELVRTSYSDKTIEYIVKDIISTRILEDDLRLMLRFEEGAGTTAEDSTQNSNDATLHGSVTWDTDNQAVVLDGSDGTYLSIPDDSSLDLTSALSICVDFSMDSLDETILFKENNSGYSPYKIVVDGSGNISFSVATDNTTQFTVSTDSQPIEADTRYTVVCTLYQGIGRIYVDGVLTASGAMTSAALLNSSGSLIFGKDAGVRTAGFRDIIGLMGVAISSGTQQKPNFDGKIFRASLYSRALSAIEARRWGIDMLEVKAPRRLLSEPDTVIPSLTFPYVYPADCFSTITRMLGMAWRIDQNMFVRLFDLTGTPSQTISEDDATLVQGSVSVETDVSQIRNAVYVRGGIYPTSWRSDVITAIGSETFALPYKYHGFEMFTDTPSLCNSLVSWYKMQESSGNLTDEKSTNTLTASNLTYEQSGKIGNAVSFNGTSSTARKTSASHPTEEHSLAAWIHPSSHDTTERVVIGIGDFSGNMSRLSIVQSGSTYYLRHRFNGVTSDVDVGDLSSAWHLVAASYVGTSLTLYLDGELLQTVSLASAPTIDSGVLEIGGSNGSNVFDGLIDECTVFNYSMSEQEHMSLYLLGESGTSAALLHTGIEFINTSGYDAYYNYSEKNYRFDTAPSSGVEFYATGQPQLPVQALRINEDSIDTYGRRELEVNEPSIESLATARQRAAAELALRKDPTIKVSFSTHVSGISPGDIIQLDLPSYGITRACFVQKVSTRTYFPVAYSGKKHLYTIECVNVLSKDWIDFLRDAFRRPQTKIDPTESEPISDIVDHTEVIGLADAHSVATPVDHAEDIDFADSHTVATVSSGGYKWSNDAGTTTNKLRWNLGDWA